MNIKSSVETVTPQVADKILTDSKDQVKNRNVADCHVEWLSDQMKAGKWRTNGEPIILDDEGFLLDGQHRLYAVVMSGATIETVVTRGVDRSTFATIDTGSARTTGNVMSIAGEANASTIATALGWVHRYEVGAMLHHARFAGFTSQIALNLVKKHPTLREDVTWAVGMRSNVFLKNIPAASLAFMKYAFGQYKPNKATEFFELVGDIRQDEPGTPTRTLRDWILKTERSRRPASTLEIMAVTVKAWTAFLNGDRPKTYVWYRTTQYPESFPTFPGDKESKGKAIRANVPRDGRPSKSKQH